MNDEQNEQHEHTEKNEQLAPSHDAAVVSPNQSVVKEKPKQKRSVGMRGVIITGFICFLIGSLLAAGGLAGAFLLGKNWQAQSIDQTRQTIVQEGEVIADVAQKVSPSVVSIITEQQSTVESLYFGSRTKSSQAAGTGLIIDANGLILTNKHVVPESTSSVQVVTSDGVVYDKVTIIGRDPLNDLAVIKVTEPKNFQAASLANSDAVRTGQKVIAIGNALGQFQNTVTSGIISGMGRPVEAGDEDGTAIEQLSNLFQTDAAINSGNSGGPLLNYSGEVIGINTAVAEGAENIGFSIPINEAKGIIESVKTTGKVSRPFLGVQFVMLTSATAKELNLTVTQGAYISDVAGSIVAGGPAQKAGIQARDVIIRVNDITLDEKTPLSSAISRFKVGETVQLTVVRGGQERTLAATLTEAPGN